MPDPTASPIPTYRFMRSGRQLHQSCRESLVQRAGPQSASQEIGNMVRRPTASAPAGKLSKKTCPPKITPEPRLGNTHNLPEKAALSLDKPYELWLMLWPRRRGPTHTADRDSSALPPAFWRTSTVIRAFAGQRSRLAVRRVAPQTRVDSGEYQTAVSH